MFYPARAAQCHKFGCTHANTHAPVGADDPVRPAVCTRKHERTNANPHNVCRGRCRALPARRTTVFTTRCGKSVIAQRADRGVRPYRALCVVADGGCNFAVARRRVDVGIDPYGHIALSPFIVRLCDCVLRGRGRTPPLRLDWECGQTFAPRMPRFCSYSPRTGIPFCEGVLR